MIAAPPRQRARQFATKTARVTIPTVSASVELVNVSKTFGSVEALAPTDISIPAGEILTLLGPSGCGKTTMLRLIAGLVPASTGTITVDGMSPAQARAEKRIGFVPQAPALLPWRSVRANVSLLLEINAAALDLAGPAPPSTSCWTRSG